MTEQSKPLWMERWFQLLLGSLVLLTVVALVVPWLLGLIYALRSVLLPLVIALGLAYIFNPIVTWLHRRLRLPRWAGTGVVFIGAMWAILILGLLILPPLISQGTDLIKKAKAYPEKITTLVQEESARHRNADAAPREGGVIPEDAVGDAGAGTAAPVVESAEVAQATTDTTGAGPEVVTASEENLLDHLRVIIDDALGPERAAELLASAVDWLSTLDWGKVTQFVLTSLDVGVGVVGSALSLTSYFILSAIIAGFCFFFFSWKLDKLIAWFVPFIPTHHRTEVLGVIVMMDKSVAGFIRGRLVQASVMAIILSIGWWLAGVPSWLLLGVLSGLLNLVPFAAVVGFLAALILATVDSVAGGSVVLGIPSAVNLSLLQWLHFSA